MPTGDPNEIAESARFPKNAWGFWHRFGCVSKRVSKFGRFFDRLTRERPTIFRHSRWTWSHVTILRASLVCDSNSQSVQAQQIHRQVRKATSTVAAGYVIIESCRLLLTDVNMTERTVVILGGHGTFGRHITESLSTLPGARVTIAGRQPGKGVPIAKCLGIDFRQCDASNSISLKNAVTDAWLVVNASGPFNASDYSIPQTCIGAGCHYIDIADGRKYVAGIVQLDEAARAQNVFACAGASTTPAVTSALIAALATGLGKIRSIKVALNAGNQNQAGVSTIATILSYVGRPVQVWQDGEWQTMRGWSEGEFIEFPPPVGRRRVQLCEVPDLELFPQHFGADTVVFKAGVELTILNYGMVALAKLKRICPPLDLPSLARPLVSVSRWFKLFGTLHGSCAVWVTDTDGRQKSIALVARQNGPRIPGSPAILLARKLLSDGMRSAGAFPCIGMLSLPEVAEFLAPFNISIVRGEDGIWKT